MYFLNKPWNKKWQEWKVRRYIRYIKNYFGKKKKEIQIMKKVCVYNEGFYLLRSPQHHTVRHILLHVYFPVDILLIFITSYKVLCLHFCRVFWEGCFHSYSYSIYDIPEWTDSCVSTHHNKRGRWIQRKHRCVHGTTGRCLRIVL